MSVKAVNTGIIIIGGGVVKHHICNANLMVNKSLCIIINVTLNDSTFDLGIAKNIIFHLQVML